MHQESIANFAKSSEHKALNVRFFAFLVGATMVGGYIGLVTYSCLPPVSMRSTILCGSHLTA
ncbi:hypothetical protein FHT76_006954 [Rhizobium sp. BK176]|nr:hypothetical protein [Rhizobium sp. BK181]MCS4095244.1 hypothetical protein [Rhizobium sp. BK176]